VYCPFPTDARNVSMAAHVGGEMRPTIPANREPECCDWDDK
jgi:hypothetical protein